MKVSIVLTGVGGQGIVTAAKLLGMAAVRAGVNSYASEVHGMAQRGGSVNCTVRMGDVHGPLVPTGGADILLSLEPVEALRNLKYVNKKTKIITDTHPIVPFTVAVGKDQYPAIEQVFSELEKNGELHKIDALSIAKQSGAIITKNVVMVGALAGSGLLPFDENILLETVLDYVPAKFREVNKKAFEAGKKAVQGK